MSHPPNDGSDVAAAPHTGDEDQPFAALVQVLAEQIEAARRGDVDTVLERARQADVLIEQARVAGTSPDPACRRRLLRLHDQVRLCLAQQQEELARRRAQLGRGKDTLQAYRNAGGVR